MHVFLLPFKLNLFSVKLQHTILKYGKTIKLMEFTKNFRS